MKKYTAKFFLGYLSQIPRNQWTVGTLKNEANQSCVLGLCGVKDGDSLGPYQYSTMGQQLKDLFDIHVGLNPLDVNDYEYHLCDKNAQSLTTSKGFTISGKHPKTRVIRAIKFIIRKQSK